MMKEESGQWLLYVKKYEQLKKLRKFDILVKYSVI